MLKLLLLFYMNQYEQLFFIKIIDRQTYIRYLTLSVKNKSDQIIFSIWSDYELVSVIIQRIITAYCLFVSWFVSYLYFPIQKVEHVDNEMCKVCGVQIV